MVGGDILKLLRGVDRLLSLEQDLGKAIERLASSVGDLQTRVNRLENREEILIVEAKSAASAAASQVAIASIVDLARRVGGLEERNPPRLAPSQTGP